MKKPIFLFPASPLNSLKIDEMFLDQAQALRDEGFITESIDLYTRTVSDISKSVPVPGQTYIYRGWMLCEKEYDTLLEMITAMGGTPFITKEQYYATHYLPNWYPLVERLTPTTIFKSVENADTWIETAKFLTHTGEKIQIKDYVKSLKTAGGSVITSEDEVETVLTNMQKYRGTIEGGICLRKWEEFMPNSEKRYFVLNGKFYSPDSELYDMRAMDILVAVAHMFPIPSPFFSVDIAERQDGIFRIVEIGDGQVSDLVQWTSKRFAEIWSGQCA
jgi:hypothetical protein